MKVDLDDVVTSDDVLFLTRISNAPKSHAAVRDYDVFQAAIRKGEEAFWDSDAQKTVKRGDVFGFVVGGGGRKIGRNIDEEFIYLYRVLHVYDENNDHRLGDWEQDGPYNPGNGYRPVRDRPAISLQAILHEPICMATFNEAASYKPAFHVQGTQKLKNVIPDILKAQAERLLQKYRE